MTARALLMPIALGLLCWASTARCNDVLQLGTGFAKAVHVASAEKGKFTAIIGDPTIADFTYGPQNTFMFIGKKDGITNIIVLRDGDGTEMYNARIEVSSGEVDLMRIHNKALVTSFTTYRCSTDSCVYVTELTATEPAALPRGNSSIQSSGTIQSSSGTIQSSPAIQSSSAQPTSR
jgi:Flp pilus assembly secretin CpaC